MSDRAAALGPDPDPDLVVTGDIDLDEPVVDGAAVRLVREITSPSNAATDQVPPRPVTRCASPSRSRRKSYSPSTAPASSHKVFP